MLYNNGNTWILQDTFNWRQEILPNTLSCLYSKSVKKLFQSCFMSNEQEHRNMGKTFVFRELIFQYVIEILCPYLLSLFVLFSP